MKVKTIKHEDFSSYKKPSMLIGFPQCSWKCEEECRRQVCQNGILASAPDIDIPIQDVVDSYIDNKLTSAVVCGGLEPFDSFDDLLMFIKNFRKKSSDDIVIFTGYNESEISNKITALKQYKNIIIKFGRYIPNQNKHYDEILGVYLASDNQYAKFISED